MSAAVASSPPSRSEVLLGAMRRNLELLIELEKSDPAGVATIVVALVAHLRSWKPMAATSIPVQLDTGPVALVDAPSDAVNEIERSISADGKYRLIRDDDHVVLQLHDQDGDHAVGVMTPGQAATMRDDLARVIAPGGR